MQLVRTMKSGICPRFMSIHSELNHSSLIIISIASLYETMRYPHMARRCVCVIYELRKGILQRCAPVENMWLFLPQSHVASQSTCQSSVIAGKANGMGQRGDYKAAWCFHWGLPCWATWSQLPLSAVNPLNPAEEPIHKCVTHPGGAFCVE